MRVRQSIIDSTHASLQAQADVLDQQEKQHFHKLKRILHFVRYPTPCFMYGRFMHQDTAVVYWPQVSETSLRHLAQDLYPPSVCVSDCATLGIHPRDVDSIHLIKCLKPILEKCVQPMLLSPYVRSSQEFIQLVAQQLDRVTDTPRGVETGRRDPANYTLFRRYILHEKTHRRLFTPPIPRDTGAFADQLPLHYAVLQEAWEALSHRAESAFDSFDGGVEYLPCGLLAINWLRYTRVLSQELVPGVAPRRIEPRAIAAAFEADSALLGRLLAVRIGSTAFEQYFDTLVHRDFCTPDDAPFVSFFDTTRVYEGKHERLFKGGWYFHKGPEDIKRRRLRAQGYRQSSTAAGTPTAIPIMFKPYEYIKDEVEHGVLPAPWFDLDHQEPIYTVKSRKEFCFHRPALLSHAAQVCPTETEMWRRVLDAFRITELVDPGNPNSIKAIVPTEMKSEFLRRARVDFLSQVAKEIISDFDTLEGLRPRDLARVKKKAQRLYVEEQSHLNTAKTRWYHDGIAKQVLEAPRLVDLRAHLTVRFQDDPVPRQEVFFRPTAIKMFLKLTTPQVGGRADAGVVPVRDAMINAWRPAPYVLAWARFCNTLMSTAHSSLRDLSCVPDAEPTAHWSPQEDLALLMDYHTFPPLTHEAWRELLSKLNDRTQAMAYHRILILRKVLKRVLRRDTLMQWWPGSGTVCGDEVAARRIILMYGLAQKRKIQHLNDTDSGLISRVLCASTERIMAIQLPRVYATDYFRNFRP